MEKRGLSNSLHMRGGTGPGSYNEYSQSLESNLNEFFWPRLSHAIANACRKQQLLADDDAAGGANFFAMADFGCSSGWNTVNSMHFMAKCVIDQASKLSLSRTPHLHSPAVAKHQKLHIQAFFNDLPFSDFNTLFALLSSSQPVLTQAGLQFMPYGIPGSFYSRLFPSRYLQIGLCTLALHNLSQVPDAVQDKNSPAWNENGVWILKGCKTETAMAYKKQFEKDFTCFLQHRSQELVRGGLLFCVMIAAKGEATSTSPRLDRNHLHTNLQAAWRQLVSEGLLEQGSLDSFNLPLFTPTLDEVKEVVCGAALQVEFDVVEVEYVEVERAPKHVWVERAAADAETWGRTCEAMVRNFVGSLIQAHLNEPAKFELLMERLRHVAAADDEVYRSPTLCVIVLVLLQR